MHNFKMELLQAYVENWYFDFVSMDQLQTELLARAKHGSTEAIVDFDNVTDLEQVREWLTSVGLNFDIYNGDQMTLEICLGH